MTNRNSSGTLTGSPELSGDWTAPYEPPRYKREVLEAEYARGVADERKRIERIVNDLDAYGGQPSPDEMPALRAVSNAKKYLLEQLQPPAPAAPRQPSAKWVNDAPGCYALKTCVRWLYVDAYGDAYEWRVYDYPASKVKGKSATLEVAQIAAEDAMRALLAKATEELG